MAKSDDDDFDGEVAILRGGAARSFLETLSPGGGDDGDDDDDDDLSDEEASILDKLLARKSKASTGKHAKGGDPKSSKGFRYFGDR